LSEDQVKAAYVYNFAKFVEWPAEDFASSDAPFRFCILKDQPVESVLKKITRGKNLAGRPLQVVPIPGVEEAHGCQILFVDSSQDRQLRHIIESLQGQSVLTVGETKDFLEAGGMVNFIVQNEHVQFQVNHRAANQARLHISSRLLTVARLVIE
jgi:hypothetical protein